MRGEAKEAASASLMRRTVTTLTGLARTPLIPDEESPFSPHRTPRDLTQ